MLTKTELKRLYWLSGSTCAGKTTISRAIGKALGWNTYHCDEHENEHRCGADPERHPHWFEYSRLTGDELWLRPIEQHVQESEAASDEQFELIQADLEVCLRNDSRPLLYDGYLSPKNFMNLRIDKQHVYYLVATEKFQRHHYAGRPWIKDVLSRTSDPITAWENWMQRDVLGARMLEKALTRFELPWQVVDGDMDVGTTVTRVIDWFLRKTRIDAGE